MDMKECKFENHIDDYLLDKMTEEKKGIFEDHYFNCPSCFEKVKERHSLISVIKSKGNKIFHDQIRETGRTREAQSSFFERFFSFLTPKQWTVAAVSACALLVVAIGIIPNLKSPPSPQFVIDSQTVRGGSLSLFSPVNNIQTIPSEFRWDNLGEGVEYKIYIYKDNLLWSASTTLDSISLPEEVKDLLKAGEKYSWEVKAFSQEGSLIAASGKVLFQIDSYQ
jgi:hypothetical protein